jgi:Mg-chelatase subunit ChlD
VSARRGAFGLVALLAALAAPGQAQLPDALLVRCADNTNQACLTTTIDVSVDAARGIATAPAGALDSAWRIRFQGDDGIVAFARRLPGVRSRPARILMLVDVSGSMRNLGIGTAKIVLKDNLLRSLESMADGAIQVAVAPFGSVDVAGRIRSARFVPPAQAIDQVEALPTPERENTGLYSAIDLGAERLKTELAQAGPDALGVLVVLTDGNNDVDHPGDDPGLLTGPAGLQTAARSVAGSGLVTAVIGLGGGVDPRALQTLAGPRGRSYVVPLDAFELARPLDDIRNLLSSTWEVAFPVPSGGREELGRGWTAIGTSLALGGGAAGATGVAVWRPPVMALPAFSGVVSPGVIPAGISNQLGGSGVIDRRIPLALFVLILLALLWLVLPRMLWPRIVPAGAAAAAAPKKKAKLAGGLRTDLKEAAPRKPADVTAAKARAG